MNREVGISKGLFHFIREYISDYYSLQLIVFFAHHAYAKFSEIAITQALTRGGRRKLFQEALMAFIEKGIVQICITNNISLYSLNANVRDLVLELNSASTWDSENEGYYFQLFFELWYYDVKLHDFRYYDQGFVGIWLKFNV